MEITIAVVLSYISNYLLAFIISLLGAFTNEMMTAIKTQNKMSFSKILAPGIFDGFLLCALQSHFNITFSIYAFICFIMGMWGLQLIEIITNKKFVFTFFRAFLNNFSTAAAKATGEALKKVDPTEKSEQKTKDNKEEKTDEKKE